MSFERRPRALLTSAGLVLVAAAAVSSLAVLADDAPQAAHEGGAWERIADADPATARSQTPAQGPHLLADPARPDGGVRAQHVTMTAVTSLAVLADDVPQRDAPTQGRGAWKRRGDADLAATPSETSTSAAAPAPEPPAPAWNVVTAPAPHEPGQGLPGSPSELAYTNERLVGIASDAGRPLAQRVAALRRVWLPPEAEERYSLVTRLEAVRGDPSMPSALRSAAQRASRRVQRR